MTEPAHAASDLGDRVVHSRKPTEHEHFGMAKNILLKVMYSST